jgi:hypothetical protein
MIKNSRNFRRKREKRNAFLDAWFYFLDASAQKSRWKFSRQKVKKTFSQPAASSMANNIHFLDDFNPHLYDFFSHFFLEFKTLWLMISSTDTTRVLQLVNFHWLTPLHFEP